MNNKNQRDIEIVMHLLPKWCTLNNENFMYSCNTKFATDIREATENSKRHSNMYTEYVKLIEPFQYYSMI